MKLLVLAALGEAATGLALVAFPTIVVRLLFGAEIVGTGVIISRVAGISLIALGLACWPGSDASVGSPKALIGMLCYSMFATLYLAYLGVSGEWVGILLWPAVAVHTIWILLLARAWLTDRRTK